MPAENAASSLFEGSVADSFGDHEHAVRGRVRYSLVRRNLEPYVSDRPLKVADIGGGSGIDALWLAEQGHEITLVEPAADQLGKAQKRISRASPEVQDRITLIHGDLGDLAEKDQNFDLVLAHCVAMYLDERDQFIRDLVVSAGAKVLQWSGVRTFSEDIDQLASELPDGLLEQIVEAEFIAGKDESRRGYGKLLHFIAEKG